MIKTAMVVWLLANPLATDLPDCGAVVGGRLSVERFSVPELNVEAEAELGENMLLLGSVNTHRKGITIPETLTFTGSYLGGSYVAEVPAGHAVVGIENGVEVFYPSGYRFKYNRERNWRRSPPELVIRLDTDKPPYVAVINFGLSRQAHPITAPIQEDRCVSVTGDRFRKELIYGGVSQGTVSLEYREFINDMARPAFSQTLRYDLSEGRTIGFRGARFEIIDANNLGVTYRVLRPLE